MVGLLTNAIWALGGFLLAFILKKAYSVYNLLLSVPLNYFTYQPLFKQVLNSNFSLYGVNRGNYPGTSSINPAAMEVYYFLLRI